MTSQTVAYVQNYIAVSSPRNGKFYLECWSAELDEFDISREKADQE